jgi:tetratricopeptide (TPR) repeat protein
MESKAFKKDFGYSVTNETEKLDSLTGITPEIKAVIQKIVEIAQNDKQAALKETIEAIEKYPHIPEFKNYLTVSYKSQGKLEKAYELNMQILKEHPDYLYAKMNLAKEYLYGNDYDSIPAILGEAMDIKALYPNRTLFHIIEMVNFYQIAVQYFIAKEDIENTDKSIEVLELLQKEFGEDLNLNEDLWRYSILLMGLRLKLNLANA